jgi:hypothetical protein
MAAYYASQEKIWLGRIAQDDRFLEQLEQSVANYRDRIQERFLREMRTISEHDRSVVSHYARLKQKYQRAAWRPWESLPPDPLDPLMAPIPAETPESPVEPDTSPRNPERRIEPRPFLTLAPGRASRGESRPNRVRVQRPPRAHPQLPSRRRAQPASSLR